MPMRMSVSLLYYRKDLLKAAGIAVPKTFEEFGRSAKVLTRDGVNGAAIQGVMGSQGVLDWYEYAAPMGVDLLDMPGQRKAMFNTPAGIAVLEQRREMVMSGVVDKGAGAFSFDDAITAINQGKVAMSVMFAGYWQRFEDPKQSKVVGEIGYAPPMRSPGVNQAYPVRGWGMAINSVSTKKELAWEFIRFLSDAPQQKWMGMNKGNAITRLSVLRDPEVVAKVPISATLAATLAHAKPMPSSPQLTRAYDIMGRHFNASLIGAVKAAEAMKMAESEVNALFS